MRGSADENFTMPTDKVVQLRQIIKTQKQVIKDLQERLNTQSQSVKDALEAAAKVCEGRNNLNDEEAYYGKQMASAIRNLITDKEG